MRANGVAPSPLTLVEPTQIRKVERHAELQQVKMGGGQVWLPLHIHCSFSSTAGIGSRALVGTPACSLLPPTKLAPRGDVFSTLVSPSTLDLQLLLFQLVYLDFCCFRPWSTIAATRFISLTSEVGRDAVPALWQ
jgi:hypothetical protein